MAGTTTEYIQHHLTNLTYGQHPDGTWGFAQSAEEAQAMGFMSINVDSMGWAIGLGLIFCWIFRKAAKNATSGVPGPLQNGVEMIVDFIDDTTQSIFHHKNDLIAPLALTIFVWVFFMNLMDLIPVDWIPELAMLLGVPYMKIVPSTDPNITMAMALTVFAMILYYSIKCKGGWGFFKELAFHPDVYKRQIHRLAQRHLLDSLTGARHLAGNSVLDIGSGAGFPGVPLAIVSPAIVAPQRSFCLCERMSRRARFLAQVQRTLGLQNVTVVDQDVNTLSETFDTVVARAVATAAELWAMVQGRLSEEGQLLVYAQVRYDEGKNRG